MLLRDGEPVPLTPKVLDLLLVLIENRGQLLEKDRLMQLLWADSFVEEANLAQNVAVLRKALGEAPREHRFIVTVPGRGYKFVAEVREVRSAPAEREVPQQRRKIEPASTKPPTLTPVLVASVLCLVAVAAAAGVWFGRGRSDPPSVYGRTSQVTTWSGLDFYPTLSPDGNTVAYSSDRSGSFEIYIKQLIPGARDVQLTSDGGQNFEPAFSADGALIAYHSKLKGGIWVVPTTGGTPHKVSDFGTRPTWSPDSSEIAFQSDPLTDLGGSVRSALPPSTLWRVTAKGGSTPVQVTKPGVPRGGHGSPSWSHDGKWIAFESSDWASSVIWTVAPDGSGLKQITLEDIAAGDPIFAADDSSLFCVVGTGIGVARIDLSPSGDGVGSPTPVIDSTGNRIRHLTVSSTGRKLAYSALLTNSNIWKVPISSKIVATGPPVQLTQNSYSRTLMPAFSPDGSKIAFQSYTAGAKSSIWIMNADGNDQNELASDGLAPWFFPDGRHLGYGLTSDDPKVGGGYGMVDTLTGSQKRLLDLDDESAVPRVSPDGTRIAFASKKSGSTNTWIENVDGSGLHQLTFDKEFAGFPSWSPDGKWIALELKRGDDTHVAIIPSDGGDITQLTNENGQSWSYSWSADGDHIIFVGQRDGIWNVYSLSVSSRALTKITNYSKLNSYVRYPAISPNLDSVAYEYSETTGNIWTLDLK